MAAGDAFFLAAPFFPALFFPVLFVPALFVFDLCSDFRFGLDPLCLLADVGAGTLPVVRSLRRSLRFFLADLAGRAVDEPRRFRDSGLSVVCMIRRC